MTDNSFVIEGNLEDWNTHTIDTSNTVNGKPVYYWKNQTNNIIPAGAGQVILANCSNVIIDNQNVSDGTIGISLGFSSECTITNNTITSNNEYGISLYSSNNNNITRNNVSNNDYGIYIDWHSDHNNITNNKASNNWLGISLFSSSNNNITRNNVSNNDYGIFLYSSSSNTISHNGFINNIDQAYDYDINQWDNGYPSGGNYWSDFSWFDNCSGIHQNEPNPDGIWDAPYNISGGDNQDRYPLTNPWREQPYQPVLIQPLDGATGVSTSPILQVQVSDPNADPMNVSFYDASTDQLIGFMSNVSSGDVTSVIWSGLSSSHTYTWYVITTDGTYGTISETWQFTTLTPGPGGGGPGGYSSQYVSNIAPMANISATDRYGIVGSLFTCNGSISTDSDGYITRWLWNFGDGGTEYSNMTTTHIYTKPGTYVILLIVFDDDGASDADNLSVEIRIQNTPPTPPIISGPTNGTTFIPSTYTIVSTDLEKDSIRYIIDWNDTTNTTSGFLPNNTIFTTTHTWTVGGVYVLHVTAMDSRNASAITINVTVLIDVKLLYINGEGYYLLDIDSDGVYDILYNIGTGEQDLFDAHGETYLLDTNGDGLWEFIYNQETDTVSFYIGEITQPLKEFPWTTVALIIISTSIVIVTIVSIRTAKKKKKLLSDKILQVNEMIGKIDDTIKALDRHQMDVPWFNEEKQYELLQLASLPDGVDIESMTEQLDAPKQDIKTFIDALVEQGLLQYTLDEKAKITEKGMEFISSRNEN